jgi:hypothetical protein
MAMFPCDVCGRRYQGKQSSAYSAIVNGAEASRGKRRLCPDCAEDLDEWITDRLVPAEETAQVMLCCACAGADPTLALFVTIYHPNSDRQDFFGRLHEGGCAGQVRQAVFGSVRAP